MKMLVNKYKAVILYLFFGVCTTIVNIASYWCCAHLLHLSTISSTVIAWLLAVLFAYVTNRIWVFESTAVGLKSICKEFWAFIICRLATGALDLGIMFVCVDLLKMNDIIIKAFANVIVIVLNYIASKLVIFKK